MCAESNQSSKQEQHSHSHSHSHSHHHDHLHTNNKTILLISFLLICGFMLVEFWAGYTFNSLALLADAGHMANDSLALLLALISLFLSLSAQKWFALLNGCSLLVVAVTILIEAFHRWQHPLMLDAIPMLSVAIIGLMINVIVAFLMLKGDLENLNLKAAYLHVLADALGSVIAIIAGISAWLWSISWVDILASALLSLFIFKSGWQIVTQAYRSLVTIN
ncbi:cation diffusion facilitator family transporter [Gallibacterium melopsittaci]|uniref:Cation diffusion facilitator family transporter n=1 Tax=Gallibacterium melopsittaci TaxID=516063 RepID=A0ABV6HYK8_9PAST